MKKKFLIEGMTCSSCVIVNKNSLDGLKGVKNVSINLANRQATIEYDEKLVSFSDIKKQIEQNGYKVNENVNNQDNNKELKKEFNRFLYSLIFSIPVISMMFVEFKTGRVYFGFDLIMYFHVLFSFIVVFVLGYHFHKNAYKALMKFHFNMDSLVSLGTITAFIYSLFAMFYKLDIYFEASVSIITLVNLGKYLEYKSKANAGSAISKLLQLQVKKATTKQDDKFIEKDIDDIKVGEIIVVKAGEKIALDGKIIDGSANIDESMLTGESIPVYKKISDECYGGTINLDGNILIEVKKLNSQGVLANIIKLVDQAQSSKAPIEHLVDKVSGMFVPTIIIISIITFIFWIFMTGDFSKAIITSVACLVIACPCALGLATPTAIMVGTGIGAQKGILIKNAETLEKTKDIDVIVFDKTGTLTKAKPEITDIIEGTMNREHIITIAKSLSSLSNHPLSKAVTNYEFKTNIFMVKNFEEIKGKGIIGNIDFTIVKLGNKKLFENINDDLNLKIDGLTKNGKTPLILGTDSEIYGIIGVIDKHKVGVENTISKMYSMGMDIIMLTGDTKATAEYIGEQIGIKKIMADLLPEDKIKIIKDLQSENNKVAFVGDGINDAPALVQADLSIAIGTGSDIAIESSDIILVKGELDKVITAINLSRNTLKVIKQNLFWAFLYNTIGIPLAAFGLLSPIFAAFAMSMSSVSVVSNSLLLRKRKL